MVKVVEALQANFGYDYELVSLSAVQVTCVSSPQVQAVAEESATLAPVRSALETVIASPPVAMTLVSGTQYSEPVSNCLL